MERLEWLGVLGRQAYYSIMGICFMSRRSTVKSDSSYSFLSSIGWRVLGDDFRTFVLSPAPQCRAMEGLATLLVISYPQ